MFQPQISAVKLLSHTIAVSSVMSAAASIANDQYRQNAWNDDQNIIFSPSGQFELPNSVDYSPEEFEKFVVPIADSIVNFLTESEAKYK